MKASGHCLCGAVRFEVDAIRPEVVNCHCGMCRRWHGHFGAYTGCKVDAFRLTQDRGLKWYASSDVAERGFCGICGSSMFWRKKGGATMGIAAGCLDAPTQLKSVKHEHVASKSDYYELEDSLPKSERE